ncbi:MAG TPA: YceI family protein [Micromonosporaceae bacterium]|nr:YceI family protein [Micromonosporaceae bacterium]
MSTQVDIPGYVAGTWVIDTARSDVSFQVRQLGVFTIGGTFDDFEGTIVTRENPRDSSVSAVIRTASVNTKNKIRDRHLRTDDFLKVEQYPTMTFASTGVRVDGDSFLVDGDLTILAVTKQVTLTVETNGFGVGHDGKPLARFSAYTEVNNREYGVIRGATAVVASNKIKVILKIEANKQD